MTRLLVPKTSERLINERGEVTKVWQRYLTGIQTLDERVAEAVAGNITTLSGTPTTTQLRDKINELVVQGNAIIAALQAAGLMEE